MWAVCVDVGLADGTRQGTYCWQRIGPDSCRMCLLGFGVVTRSYTYVSCAPDGALTLFFNPRRNELKRWRRERHQGGRTACLSGLTVQHRCCRPSVATKRVRTYLKFSMWQRRLSIFLSTRIVRFGPCVWPFRLSMSNPPSLLFGSNTADRVGPHQRSLWATNCLQPL